jgi:hypothetical protein
MESEPNKVNFVEIEKDHLYEALGVNPEQVSHAPCNPDGTVLNVDLKELDNQLLERPGFRVYYRTPTGGTFIANIFPINESK